MKEYEVKMVVDRGEEEIELSIIGNVYGGSPGRCSGPPEKCYPSEPIEAEIISIRLSSKDWNDNLSEKEESKANELLIEAYEDDDRFEEPDTFYGEEY